jgi:class 3 adenylate cyclase/outer membrane protein assembly factor BamB
VPKTRGTALRAVLFTDVVASTELARELGDERWTRLLAAQRRIVREELRAHHGREIDTAGDGFFAVFEGPADALRCAFAATNRVQELGIDIRGGVHVGEIEIVGSDAHGIVVHTGARVMGKAGAAEVLTTQTVRDLVAGSTIDLAERGSFELKGVPGTWMLFDVLAVDGVERPSPVEPDAGLERRERTSAPGAERARRRWPLAVVAAALVALGVAAAVQFRGEALHVPSAGTVARIDGDRFDAPVEVGSFPIALTQGHGRIWVMDRESQVYWVNEADGTTGSRGTDGPPTGAATGGGAVWISGGFGSGQGRNASVSRIDPTSGQLSAAFETPIGAQAIAFGAGAVWVASPNTVSVVRYDPVTRIPEGIPLRGDPQSQPDSIAFGDLGGQAVWVGDALGPGVFRLAADGSDDVSTFTVGGPVSAITVGRDSIWVASAHADEVYALDPSTGAIRTTVDTAASGCNGPAALAATPERVWVACSLSQRVASIDPGSGAITSSLAVDGSPDALTTSTDGSVWVAVRPR